MYLNDKRPGATSDNGFISRKLKKNQKKKEKKSKWINGINSKTAQSIYFLFYISILIYFFEYETIHTT